MQFKIEEIHKTMGLSQARRLGRIDPLTSGELLTPQIFTRTYSASITGDFLFSIGTGRLDPKHHARVILAYAWANEIPLTRLVDSWEELLVNMGKSKKILNHIISLLFGSQTRTIRTGSIVPVTPSVIFEKLMELISPDVPVVLIHVMTDMLCHQFNKLGWIVEDAAYVYRIRRQSIFPGFNDLVDIVTAKDLVRSLESLAEMRMDIVADMVTGNKGLNPSAVVQHFAGAIVRAHDLSAASYDPTAVVSSTLSTLGRIWNPLTPEEFMPKPRVRDAATTSELLSNLSLFIAFQDMLRNRPALANTSVYSDEELANVVIPWFVEALGEMGMYKVRALSDVVGHIGKKASRDSVGAPGHSIIYEDWDFSSEINAFSPIRAGTDTNARYLLPEVHVSSGLSSALKPVQALLSTSRIVEHRAATYDLVSSNRKVPTGGAEILLGLPSLIEREIEMELPEGWLKSLLSSGVAPETDESVSEETRARHGKQAGSLIYDYYAMITHLAVARAGTVSISGGVDDENMHVPYLVWELRTEIEKPVGPSAIYLGAVITTEPLEAIVYVDDFVASEVLNYKGLKLDEFTDHIHVWNWYDTSVSLNYQAPYSTDIRGVTHTVTINEHELLGLGARREKVRYMRPSLAVAVVRMWFSWIREEEAFIAGELKATKKDTLATEAFRGRRIQNGLSLLSTISQIGGSTFGERAAGFVRRRIADSLRGTGELDAYNELHVGIQARKLSAWSGLVTMQMLSLLDAEEVTDLIKILQDTSAMQMVIGNNDLLTHA